jgi:hypothetical protein
MEQDKLDFIINDIVYLAKRAFASSQDIYQFDAKLRKLIQDEYKYLLRGTSAK